MAASIMRILAFDTSFDACSAAVLDGDDVLWTERRIIGRGHAEILPPMVAAGLAAARLSVADLDRIGVVIGPGAFAGLRVGLAFARGLCLGTKAKAVGVTSLAALAASVHGDTTLLASVFDARRGQVYAALFDESIRPLIEPFVATPEEAARRVEAEAGERTLTLAGSGARLVAPLLSRRCEVAEAAHIDPVALARFAIAAPEPHAPPAPLYLRPPDAAPSGGGLFRGVS